MTNSEGAKASEITVYLGLGSNVGDREANLREAIGRIQKLGIEVVRESSIYETEPVGFTDQTWFLNQVIETRILAGLTPEHELILGDARTVPELQAGTLLGELLRIEHEMGRERTIPNGPRVIDIDLLLFGDMITAHSKADEEWSLDLDIVVPHPRMHLRRFVLEPMRDIAPEVVHPVLKTSCREMLASLDYDSRVRLFRRRR